MEYPGERRPPLAAASSYLAHRPDRLEWLDLFLDGASCAAAFRVSKAEGESVEAGSWEEKNGATSNAQRPTPKAFARYGGQAEQAFNVP
jgi:hypothetical protein